MRTITVKTQAEFDALPNMFMEHTTIEIRSSEKIVVKKSWDSSHVVARGSSHVVARDSSHVVAWGSSHVEAWGSSHVVARGSSHVVAWGSSHVVARENSMVRVQSKFVELNMWHNSIATATIADFVPKINGEGPAFITKPRFEHDIVSFCESYYLAVEDDSVILFKSVQPTSLLDFFTGKIRYDGVVECPDWDQNPLRECGGGLHLSPSPSLAQNHNKGTVLRCRVALKDIVVYPFNITKVRCRKVEVLGEVEDQDQQ